MTRLFAGTPFDRPPTCERCGKLEAECACPPAEVAKAPLLSPTKQTARLALERRKHGRTVSVIRGLAPADNDLAALLQQMKQACGAGGSIAEDALELQGDHLAKLRPLLLAMGYRVKG